MSTLVEVLADPDKKRKVIADGVQVIEAEVADKRGLRGAAIKAGFKSVKAIKPGILAAALDKLLPEFAPAVDPHYAKAKESGNVKGYFKSHDTEIAESMLQVTDARAATAKNKVMIKVYNGLRGQAVQHTAAAMPRLADLVEKHVG